MFVRKCKYCNSDMILKSENERRIFCSSNCLHIWHRRNKGVKKINSTVGKIHWNKGIVVKKNCPICNTEFNTTKDTNERFFCSNSCQLKHNHAQPLSFQSREKISRSSADKIMKENGCRKNYHYKQGTVHCIRLNKDFIFKSSFERDRLLQLDKDLTVKNIEKEVLRIPYIKPNGNPGHYIVDLVITYRNGLRVLEEIKPTTFVNEASVVVKSKAAIEYAKNNNYIFRIVTEKEIYLKNGVTTTSPKAILVATATTTNSSEDIV